MSTPSGQDPPPQAAPEVEALMKLSRLTTAVVARSLVEAQATVTTPQLRVLVLLSGAGGTNLTTLAAQLGVNASNASRVCEQLVTTGLVSRREAAGDRRQVALGLTEEGQALVGSLMARRRELFSTIAAAMSQPDRDDLARGLAAVLRAAEDVADTHDLLAASQASGGLADWIS